MEKGKTHNERREHAHADRVIRTPNKIPESWSAELANPSWLMKWPFRECSFLFIFWCTKEKLHLDFSPLDKWICISSYIFSFGLG